MNAPLSPTRWQRDRDENAECQSPLEASSNENPDSRKRQREDAVIQDGRSGSFALELWTAGTYALSPQTPTISKRFACPFQKAYPQSNRTCGRGLGFTDISRLKTHLKTEHDAARRCTKCWAYLPKGGPTQHRNEGKCQPGLRRPLHWLEGEQKKALNDRHRGNTGQLWYDLAKLLVEELRELPLEEVATRITPWYDDPTPFFMPGTSPCFANQLTQQLTPESMPTSNISTSSSSYNSTMRSIKQTTPSTWADKSGSIGGNFRSDTTDTTGRVLSPGLQGGQDSFGLLGASREFETAASSSLSAFQQQLSSELEPGTEPANEAPPLNIEEAHQQLRQSWHNSTDLDMPNFDSPWDIGLGLDMGGELCVPTAGVAVAKEQSSTTKTSAQNADLRSETLKLVAEELISMRKMETIQRVPQLIPRVERAFGLVSLTRIWNPKNRSGDAKLYDEVLDSLAKELILMLKLEEIQQILQLISQIERAIVLVSKIWSPGSLSAASS